MISAPKRITPTSNTGKPKAAYVYKLLGIRGFEAFAPVTFGDGRVERDHRGTPISRTVAAGGELTDIIWWRGPKSGGACRRCTIADGKARPVVLMTRRARVRGNDRVPTLREMGTWHSDCLSARLQRGRFGQDTRQHAGVAGGPVLAERETDRATLDIRTATRPADPFEAERRAVERYNRSWRDYQAACRAYEQGMGGYRAS